MIIINNCKLRLSLQVKEGLGKLPKGLKKVTEGLKKEINKLN